MNGTATISATFDEGDTGGRMSYAVYVGANQVFSRYNEWATAHFDFSPTVSIGTTIDFAVGTGASGYGYGSTPLVLTVSAVPLPGALLLFGPALAGLAVLMRRFRKETS